MPASKRKTRKENIFVISFSPYNSHEIKRLNQSQSRLEKAPAKGQQSLDRERKSKICFILDRMPKKRKKAKAVFDRIVSSMFYIIVYTFC